MEYELGILGLIIGLCGLAVTLYLTHYIQDSDKKRREKEEGFYKMETESNFAEIKTIFRNVITIANGSGGGVWDDEEKEEITYSLNEYFSNNYNKIRYLEDDTKRSLKRWKSLDASKQNQIKDVLNNLNWLIQTYFPEGISMSEHQRRWIAHHNDLHDKQKNVRSILNSIKIS